MHNEIFNNPLQKQRRKNLRNDPPRAEQLVWKQLCGSQLDGHKFRRQQGIGPYIVDFYCPELNLVVEIDGETHSSPEEVAHDEKRTAYFQELGIGVIRFTNVDVYHNLESVVEKIQSTIAR